MTVTNDSEYPHWREALFGNGHVANAWCAIKYTTWHLSRVFIAVLLLIATIPLVVTKPIVGGLGPLWNRIPESVRSRTAWTVKNAVMAGTVVFVVGALLFMIGLYLWFLYKFPTEVFIVVGILTHAFVIAYGIVRLLESEWVGGVAERTRETPGVRRLYGYCPVSMTTDPKWYEAFERRLFG